jgi:hypothetical protein
MRVKGLECTTFGTYHLVHTELIMVVDEIVFVVVSSTTGLLDRSFVV